MSSNNPWWIALLVAYVLANVISTYFWYRITQLKISESMEVTVTVIMVLGWMGLPIGFIVHPLLYLYLLHKHERA